MESPSSSVRPQLAANGLIARSPPLLAATEVASPDEPAITTRSRPSKRKAGRLAAFLTAAAALASLALLSGLRPWAAPSAASEATALRQGSALGRGADSVLTSLGRTERTAYVYIAFGPEKYFDQALVSAAQLRTFDKTRDVVLMYAGAVPSNIVVVSHALNVTLRPVPADVAEEMESTFGGTHCRDWPGCWLKLLLYNMTEYKYVLVVDSDMFMIKPGVGDAIFSTMDQENAGPYDIAGVGDVLYQYTHEKRGATDVFNGGLFALRPSRGVLKQVLEYAHRIEPLAGEQHILNEFAREHGRWIRLSPIYNVFPFVLQAMYRRLNKPLALGGVAVLHYVWLSKPRNGDSRATCGTREEDCTPCCHIWYDYVEQYERVKRAALEAASASSSNSATPSVTPSATPTPSNTPSNSGTPSTTASQTPQPSRSPSGTPRPSCLPAVLLAAVNGTAVNGTAAAGNRTAGGKGAACSNWRELEAYGAAAARAVEEPRAEAAAVIGGERPAVLSKAALVAPGSPRSSRASATLAPPPARVSQLAAVGSKDDAKADNDDAAADDDAA